MDELMKKDMFEKDMRIISILKSLAGSEMERVLMADANPIEGYVEELSDCQSFLSTLEECAREEYMEKEVNVGG